MESHIVPRDGSSMQWTSEQPPANESEASKLLGHMDVGYVEYNARSSRAYAVALKGNKRWYIGLYV